MLRLQPSDTNLLIKFEPSHSFIPLMQQIMRCCGSRPMVSFWRPAKEPEWLGGWVAQSRFH